jgi:hypothetical protein
VGLRALEKQLTGLGFRPDRSEGAPVCRWIAGTVPVDVLPTDASLLGFGNPWYLPAMRASVWKELEGGARIRLIGAPHFLATKLVAFRGRGAGDVRASHDLEDVVAVVDGRPELAREVEASSPDLHRFLAEACAALLHDPDFPDAVRGHLLPDAASQARWGGVMEVFQRLAQLPR